MILNHLWGLYAHPKEEWQTIDARHESLKFSLIHILLVALIPWVCAYFSAVHIGWSIGVGEPISLTPESAIKMAVAMYVALILGVFALAYLAHWMAHTFGSEPTYTQTLELASYTSTPLFMVGIAALYPELWFVMLVGFSRLVLFSVFVVCWSAYSDAHTGRAWFYLCQLSGNLWFDFIGVCADCHGHVMELRLPASFYPLA